MTSRSYWTAVWCGFLVLTIGLGVRQSFGIFLKPVSAELHVGRELFSFGTARVDAADGRRGAASPAGCATASARPPTIAGGGVVYVLGMIVTATMHDGAMLILGNVLVGVGLSAATFGPVLGVILRAGAAGQGSAGRRHLLGRRLVRPVLHRAAGARCCRTISATGGRPCGR